MKKMIYLMLTLIVLGAASAQAQVIIGKNLPADATPIPGALLDLQSTTLGLKIPTVALTNLTTVFQLGNGTDAANATGTVVYNNNPAFGSDRGLYVWDGCVWELAGGEPQVVVAAPLVIGGNTYSTARFGAAGIWMTENLREVPKTNPTIGAGSTYATQWYNIPNGGNNTSDTDTIAKYGYIYTWSAVMNASTAVNAGNYIGEKGNKTDAQLNGESGLTYPVQGICPDGWHVPSDWEWTQLENVLGQETNHVHYTGDACGTPSTLLNGSEFGYSPTNGSPTLDMKMRVPVKTWPGTYKVGVSKTKDNGGFAALPAGFCANGSPTTLGTDAYFWSSSSSGTANNAWYRYFGASLIGLGRFNDPKYHQFSVRCKKN